VDTTNKRIYIGNSGGSGDLIGSAPGGSDTQIQFNDGGNLGGDSGLTYNKTTDALTMVGDLNLNGGGIKSNQATVSILPSTVTTLNIGGAATALNLGTTTGTTTINSPTVVGSQTTQALYDTVATTMNFARAATSITMGAATGTSAIRNPTLRVGNTTGSITTNSTANTNHLTLGPYGKVMLVPTTGLINGGSIPSITVENTDQATGVVEIAGGDLFLTRKTADDATFTPVNIIFEGSGNDTSETTLTVENPTADRTITLPDATGTVGVMTSPTNQQIQFYDSTTKNLKGDADLIFDGTNLQIGSQGDLRLADSDSSNWVAFQAPATVASNVTWTLPSTDGTNGQALVTNGTGTLSWATAGGGTPGGSDTQVQFNDGGSTFGGDAGLTYNKTTDTLTVTGDVAVNGGDLTTTAATATLFNSSATTLSIGGATSSTINIGATGGTSTIDLNSNILKEVELRNYFESEGTVTYTGGMVQDLSFDLSTGNVFVYTTTGSISQFTVTNIPSKANTAVGFTVVLTCGNGLYAVSFDTFSSGSPVWAGGTPPTASNTVGRTDIVSYVTYDGGTTWYGTVGGLNFY
jgi:hypothetical protein